MRVSKRRTLLIAFVALLGASHLYRALKPTPVPAADKQEIEVQAVAADGSRLPRPVDIAYREWAPADPVSSVPLILLHGSPGSSRELAELGELLGQSRRVLALDLPGFGDSIDDVPSYSIRAHADYVLQVAERLTIERLDVLGFSMGGGVAIHLAELDPERVRSLVLLSAVGVQELELLGNHELNHAVHGLQLAGLWTLFELVPHFGLLDDSMISVAYARNFYDTDQRPLRRLLAKIALPTLILHGGDDPLVPIEAAREHHRLVPQSELVVLDGGHFMTFMRPEVVATPIEAFLETVDAGQAANRAQASPQRLADAERPFDPTAREPVAGFSLVVLLLLIAAATLVSEDLACIGAGLLVAQGTLEFLPAVAGCFVGIVLGDIGLYWVGRLIGDRALGTPPLSWVLSEQRVAQSAAWFESRGPLVILLSRFIPGTRLATYFSSGLLRVSFVRFSIFFVLASALWTPLLVGVSSLVGERIFEYFAVFQRHALVGVVVTFVLVWILLKLIPPLFTWRGRRLALGKWRRRTQWEFWPWWLIYLPIYLQVFWLGIRFRSLTLFTLANPGIDCGGLAGESKGDLLAQMPSNVLPRWRRIEAGLAPLERRGVLGELIEDEGIDFPVVLKPDAGERGLGVLIARDRPTAERYLDEHDGPTIAQQYIAGLEYGIFYDRRPNEAAGRITSIAAKILPSVTGDGHSSIERLILADDRTVCQADALLMNMENHLGEVPAAGEAVRLGDLGTHSRGAMFLDANHLRTPELDRAIDDIAQSVDGFFFGRFDIRVPSARALRRGESLRVLELNGVTSEEAHMYDPRHGLAYAWRTLAAQWRRAFTIGDDNRALGLEPDGVGAVVRSLRRYSRSKRRQLRHDRRQAHRGP